MIDTLCIWADPLGRLNTTEWETQGSHRTSGRQKSSAATDDGEVFIELTSYGGLPRLFVRGTLPRLVVGHNATVLSPSQLDEAVTELLARVTRMVDPVSLPDRADWELSFVDFVQDWRVKSPDAYLHEFATSLSLPQRARGKRNVYLNNRMNCETVSFGFSGKQYQVYNKEKEVTDQVLRGRTIDPRAVSHAVSEAQGKVRFEVRYRRPALHQLLGRSRCTLGVLLDEEIHRWPRQTIFDEWSALTRKWGKPTVAAAMEVLQASNFRPAYKMLLLNAFIASQSYSLNSIADVFGVSRNTPWRWESDLASVGLHLGVTDALPRLKVPLEPDPRLFQEIAEDRNMTLS